MDKYYVTEGEFPQSLQNLPQELEGVHELRINALGDLQNFVTFGALHLKERDSLLLVGQGGPSIEKTISVANSINKKMNGIHGIIYRSQIETKDVWKPKDEKLDIFEVKRSLPVVYLYLKKISKPPQILGYEPFSFTPLPQASKNQKKPSRSQNQIYSKQSNGIDFFFDSNSSEHQNENDEKVYQNPRRNLPQNHNQSRNQNQQQKQNRNNSFQSNSNQGSSNAKKSNSNSNSNQSSNSRNQNQPQNRNQNQNQSQNQTQNQNQN